MTKEEVLELAKLARLKLSPEEVSLFQNQLSSILDYINQVREFATSQTAVSEKPMVFNQIRSDDFVNISEDQVQVGIIDNAPDKQENYFKVPKVLDKNNDAA